MRGDKPCTMRDKRWRSLNRKLSSIRSGAASQHFVVPFRISVAEEYRDRPFRDPHLAFCAEKEPHRRLRAGNGAPVEPIGEVQNARLMHGKGAASAGILDEHH